MAVAYLHGVETIEINKGSRPIKVVKSAVIGLIGIAPIGVSQQNVVVYNEIQAAQFGAQITGFTIPQALDAIFKQGNATVIVINVFSATKHLVTITNEVQTVTGGKSKLTYAPVSNLVITNAATTPVTLVKDADYKIDDYGNVIILNYTNIAEGANIRASYKRLDPTTVDNNDIIGAINGTTNVRTGSKLFDLCFNLFGFKPKLFIVPGYSTIQAIAAQMIVLANKFKGISLIDAPLGTTVPVALSGRGPLGTINFYTSDKRAYLLYPALVATSPATLANENRPYSQFMAGVIANTDNQFGYWFSPSNKEIKGILGLETPISGAINDASTEANALNEVGITTVLNSFGTGFRTWGNRGASYPTSTAIDGFVCVRRTADIVEESVELAMLDFIDQPINGAVIDAIKESVNGFINTLIGRGALIIGSICSFNPNKNPPSEIALGHLTFDLTICPPAPLERLTFETFIDISLLKNLIS